MTPASGAGAPASIEAFSGKLADLRAELVKRIVGQDEVVTQILAGILSEGHCLIVGLPGLAKTLLVSSLAELLSLDFKRIQFTPDLMPSDITGANIIAEDATGHRDFRFLKGPIFANVVLADEINRTPPKTQAALMEAMEERQVSSAGRRMRLERPFFVLATQNPIELEGTYPLPISQLDRFLFKITIDYPTLEEEFRVLVLTTSSYSAGLSPVFSREELLRVIEAVRQVPVSEALLDYASRLARSTRPTNADAPPLTKELVAWGAGPRAIQAVVAGARAFSVLDGRSEVTAADIHRAVPPALRHRVLLRYHAESEGWTVDRLLQSVMQAMPDHLYDEPAPERPSSVGDGHLPLRKKGILGRLLGR